MGARGPRPGRRLRRRTGPAAGMATTAQPREAYHDLASRPLPRPAGSDPARPAALRQLAPAPRRRDPRDGADLHGGGWVEGRRGRSSSAPPYPAPRGRMTEANDAHRYGVSARRLVETGARLGEAVVLAGIRLVHGAVRDDAALALEGRAEPVRDPRQG